MTFRERLEQEHPECIGEWFDGGCRKCPDSYGYERHADCDEVDGNCEDCWNRELPE